MWCGVSAQKALQGSKAVKEVDGRNGREVKTVNYQRGVIKLPSKQINNLFVTKSKLIKCVSCQNWESLIHSV